MSNVTWVVITDGRPLYLDETMMSARSMVVDNFYHKIIMNDSGDSSYANRLKVAYPDFDIISHPERMGLAQAIRTIWNNIPEGTDYLFHLEEDFIFNKTLDTQHIARVLDHHPELAQMLFMRDAVNPAEREVGGWIRQHDEDYDDVSCSDCGEQWMTHRRLFSLNPCLYKVVHTKRGWPEHGSEGDFTTWLNEEPSNRYGVWGRRTDDPFVTHIGSHRSEEWLL